MAIYKKGMTGTPVKVIQIKLLSMGFYKGRVDGIFGSMTEAAVQRFQSAAGLKQDGIVGGDTLYQLDRHFRAFTANLQRKLTLIGYYKGKVDGDYGPLTLQAVRTFQTLHGLTATGHTDPTTYALIDREVAQSAPRMMRFGDYGEDVRALQVKLNSLHFIVGTPTGGFGIKTRDAVKRLQNAYLLSADGVVGPETMRALKTNGQVSPHFHIEGDTLYSRGNGNLILDGRLIVKLEKLRHALGDRPIKINSAYRDPVHNRRVGGVSNSQHLYGKAADIIVSGVSPAAVAATARKVGFTWVGLYNTFTHVDVR
jgi:peptidoglycan hydrolase-like protein with peptidoglycan-binding domain